MSDRFTGTIRRLRRHERITTPDATVTSSELRNRHAVMALWLCLGVALVAGCGTPPAGSGIAPMETSCTVGRVGTAMTETVLGPVGVVKCDAWVQGNPKLIFLTDEPKDSEHHVLCQFHFGDVTRTVRDTGAGAWGAQRCQQLANGQQALS